MNGIVSEKETLLRKIETILEDGSKIVLFRNYEIDKRVREYTLNKDGKLDGYYHVYDDQGEHLFRTYFENGVEDGLRVERVQGLEETVWRHTMVENGIPQESTYSSSKGADVLESRISPLEVQRKLELANEQTTQSISVFDPNEWFSDQITTLLNDRAEAYGFDDYSFCEEVLSTFHDHIIDYSNVEDFFDDLSHGCSSGILGEVVYYADTKEFYEKHLEDIEEYINEIAKDIGPFTLDPPRYNSATWLVYEQMGYVLSNDINYELETQLTETLPKLTLPELEAVKEVVNNELVCDVVSEYIEENKEELVMNKSKDLSKVSKLQSNLSEGKNKRKGRSL